MTVVAIIRSFMEACLVQRTLEVRLPLKGHMINVQRKNLYLQPFAQLLLFCEILEYFLKFYKI